MLLIDFDKLMEAYNDFYDEFTVYDLRFLKKKCLPIVEAIPVEWILHYVDTHYNVDNFDDIWRYIMKMHDEWEKENADNN